MLKKYIFDYKNPKSLGSILRKRRSKNLKMLIDSYGNKNIIKILDIGGTKNIRIFLVKIIY